MMTVVLGTLPFIATLWLLVALGAAILEENGGKIVAALKGHSLHQYSREPSARRTRIRMNKPAASPVMPHLRAAA